MAVDANILSSKYVEPKKNGYGYTVRRDAPDRVKKRFAEFQAAQKAVRGAAKGRKK